MRAVVLPGRAHPATMPVLALVGDALTDSDDGVPSAAIQQRITAAADEFLAGLR